MARSLIRFPGDNHVFHINIEPVGSTLASSKWWIPEQRSWCEGLSGSFDFICGPLDVGATGQLDTVWILRGHRVFVINVQNLRRGGDDISSHESRRETLFRLLGKRGYQAVFGLRVLKFSVFNNERSCGFPEPLPTVCSPKWIHPTFRVSISELQICADVVPTVLKICMSNQTVKR
jgi:hypothetical protein